MPTAARKEHTLNYIHYMQTVLGHPELGIADDEFPTPDGLPFIPYVRETRRIVGDVVMREQDVLPTEGNGMRPPLQRDFDRGGRLLPRSSPRARASGSPELLSRKVPEQRDVPGAVRRLLSARNSTV